MAHNFIEVVPLLFLVISAKPLLEAGLSDGLLPAGELNSFREVPSQKNTPVSTSTMVMTLWSTRLSDDTTIPLLDAGIIVKWYSLYVAFLSSAIS